jgi:hypothetical protein
MKRCPECRRDYYDDTLSFCLEDGSPLVSGVPAESLAGDEPATAIWQSGAPIGGRSITYVSRVEGLRDIWSQPLEGGEPKKMTNFKTDQIFSFAWSRENKLVISHGSATSDVVLIRNIKQ